LGGQQKGELQKEKRFYFWGMEEEAELPVARGDKIYRKNMS